MDVLSRFHHFFAVFSSFSKSHGKKFLASFSVLSQTLDLVIWSRGLDNFLNNVERIFLAFV